MLDCSGLFGAILELIRSSGYIAIDELATRFRVTPQTLRADLNQLADAGLLIRHQGGASIPSSISNSSCADRHSEFAGKRSSSPNASRNGCPTGRRCSSR